MRTSAVELLVIFDNGASRSLLAMVCRASIVADCGGVFSPSMLCGGRRSEGLTWGNSRLGVSRPGVGVAVRLVDSFSGDLNSRSLLK